MGNPDQPEQFVAYLSAKDLGRYGINLADVKAGIVMGIGVDPFYSRGKKKYQVTQDFLDSIDMYCEEAASSLLDLDDVADVLRSA